MVQFIRARKAAQKVFPLYPLNTYNKAQIYTHKLYFQIICVCWRADWNDVKAQEHIDIWIDPLKTF